MEPYVYSKPIGQSVAVCGFMYYFTNAENNAGYFLYLFFLPMIRRVDEKLPPDKTWN